MTDEEMHELEEHRCISRRCLDSKHTQCNGKCVACSAPCTCDHHQPKPEQERKETTCTAPGCIEPPLARNLCSAHYAQSRRHGRLTPVRKRKVS